MRFIYAILLGLSLHSASSLANSGLTGVCARSPQVKAALEKSLKKTCDAISPRDLLALSSLTVGAFDQPLQLQGGDFQGLTKLTTLTVAFGAILKEIPARVFVGLDNLKNLVLDDTGTEVMTRDSFAGIPHLESLNLNSLRALQMDVDEFSLVPELKTLSVGNSFLRKIPSDAFQGLSKLTSLIVGGLDGSPDSVVVERGAFARLHSLRSLELVSGASGFDPNWAEDLDELTSLDLNGGTETPNNFDLSTLARMKKLTRLQLSGIKISVPLLTSAVHAPLTELALLNSGLSEIPANGFVSYPHLKILRIMGSPIRALNTGFEGLLQLEEVSLYADDIESFGPSVFRDVQHLRLLVLSDNENFGWKGFATSGLKSLGRLEANWIGFCGIGANPFTRVHVSVLDLGQVYEPRCVTQAIRHSVGKVIEDSSGS